MALRDRVLKYINLVEASEFIKTAQDDVMMNDLSAPLQVNQPALPGYRLSYGVSHTKCTAGRIRSVDFRRTVLQVEVRQMIYQTALRCLHPWTIRP